MTLSSAVTLTSGHASPASKTLTGSKALVGKNAVAGRRFHRALASFFVGSLLLLGAGQSTAGESAQVADLVLQVAVVDRAPIPFDAAPARVNVAAVFAPVTGSAPTAAPQAEANPNELLDFGAMRVQRWIVETILKASAAADVDPVYMMALADKESSFIPANKASTSSAEGLFQFISSTWLQMVRTYGAKHGLADEAAAIKVGKGGYTVADAQMKDRILRLRRDPYLSALMAAEMLKRDRELIEKRIGREIQRSEYYLAHFLGANSAGKLMALVDGKPTEAASRAFPAAAKANKSLFFAKDGGKTRHLSVAELYERIEGMMDKRFDRYERVNKVLTADASF